MWLTCNCSIWSVVPSIFSIILSWSISSGSSSWCTSDSSCYRNLNINFFTFLLTCSFSLFSLAADDLLGFFVTCIIVGTALDLSFLFQDKPNPSKYIQEPIFIINNYIYYKVCLPEITDVCSKQSSVKCLLHTQAYWLGLHHLALVLCTALIHFCLKTLLLGKVNRLTLSLWVLLQDATTQRFPIIIIAYCLVSSTLQLNSEQL